MRPDPNADLSDLEMMLDPTRWPNFIPDKQMGILPLKHPDADWKDDAAFGVLAAAKSQDGWLYSWEWKANLAALKASPDPKHIAQGMQELVRLLVQCGWVVD